jgi:isocitrate/isopropylmalate dehydrogenase
MLLRYSAGLLEESEKIMQAVQHTLAEGIVSQDLKGRRNRLTRGTDAIGQYVVQSVTDLLQIQMAYHAV